MIRRLSCALLLAALGTQVAAFPLSPSQRAEAFATCAGRYAAYAVHSSDRLNTDKRLFDDLLEAVMPAAVAYGMPRSHVASMKFQAWLDHSSLHNDASYATDPGRKARAAARLARDMAECDALVL